MSANYQSVYTQAGYPQLAPSSTALFETIFSESYIDGSRLKPKIKLRPPFILTPKPALKTTAACSITLNYLQQKPYEITHLTAAAIFLGITELNANQITAFKYFLHFNAKQPFITTHSQAFLKFDSCRVLELFAAKRNIPF